MPKIPRFLTFLFLAALTIPVPAMAQTTGKNPSHEDILRGFDISPLYADREAGRTGVATGANLTGLIHKWTTPIVFAVEGLQHDKIAIALLRQQVQRIAGIAGVAIREAEPGSAEINFKILIRDAELRLAGARVSCYATSNYDRWKGNYTRAELHVNLASSPDITRCAIHELLHAFGMNGHPHKLHSILSYYTDRFVFDLTEPDEVMLRTLYDPRLKPGLSRLPALMLADGIIEEKRRALNPNAPPKTSPDAVLRAVVADLEKLSGEGNVRAMLHLAEAYRFGMFLPKDEAKMAAMLARAEAVADPAQRFDLAYALANGFYVPKDETRAVAIYRQGAEQNHVVSQNNLGHHLRQGIGTAADKVEAMVWFSIAAQSGTFALAQRNRDALAKELSEADRAEAESRAKAWKPRT